MRANTPLCTLAQPLSVHVAGGGGGGGEMKMVLSSILLGDPLLSCHHSLAPGTQYSCKGTTQHGTFVSICRQFTVALT